MNWVVAVFLTRTPHRTAPSGEIGAPKSRSTQPKPALKYGPWQVRPTTAKRMVRTNCDQTEVRLSQYFWAPNRPAGQTVGLR